MVTKELIASCLRRERAGEKRLYERYVATMAGTCKRYLKNDADMQDALIEGFVKVFNKLHTFEFRGEQSLEIWIRRIMINECLMKLRKGNRYLFVEADLPRALHEIEAKEIVELMQRLPTGYRTVLNLYIIDGYSHKEIADMLGITESASRSQLTHARNKFKHILKLHGWNGMIK